MAQGPRVSMKLEQARLNRVISDFKTNKAPQVSSRGVRKIAFNIGSELVQSLNGEQAGYTNPKRIDTGRYRAGWVVAIQQATGLRAGPTFGGESGDGRGAMLGRGASRTAVVENAVEYGPYLEYGTVTKDGREALEPGLHLQRALRVGTREVQAIIGAELSDVWDSPLGAKGQIRMAKARQRAADAAPDTFADDFMSSLNDG